MHYAALVEEIDRYLCDTLGRQVADRRWAESLVALLAELGYLRDE